MLITYAVVYRYVLHIYVVAQAAAFMISQAQLQDMPNRLCTVYIQLFCNSHL